RVPADQSVPADASIHAGTCVSAEAATTTILVNAPLDEDEPAEELSSLRRSIRKKSIAKKRTTPPSSSIPFSTDDPDAAHRVHITFASDDSDDDDTPHPIITGQAGDNTDKQGSSSPSMLSSQAYGCQAAFFNGHLSEDVYMVQPEGFMDRKHPNKLCKLQHSIYGLKQASRSWNKKFDEEIKKIGFTQNPNEPCVYLKASRNLREAAYIFRIKIIRNRSKWLISLSKIAYFDKILKKFKMENSKRGSTPMQEKLDYKKSQGAQTPSEQNPGDIHWTAVNYILKYLRNTKDTVLVYKVKPKFKLKVTCYADAGFQTDKDDTKSQSGYVFMLNDGVVDWKSAKQSTTTMSSTEAEYIAATEASMEAV
nr:hypothetical protein [Tanacetum cinerariifolium]